MKKFASVLISAAIIATPFALLTTPVQAKTSNQMKNEKKGADAKAASKAKSASKKSKK
jgi:Ni/Co efflux regulator RcnB